MPFMAVFNNLVIFDQKEKINSPDNDRAGPGARAGRGTTTRRKLTFKLRQGVKWHDGKPFIGQGREVHLGRCCAATRSRTIIRKNPRKVWYNNLKEVDDQRRLRGHLHPEAAAAVVPVDARLRLLAGLSLPRAEPRTCAPSRSAPARSSSSSSSATKSIKLVRNPDYWKKGRPYLDAIECKIVPNRSTRMLAFVAGEFDMTFDSDVTIPLLKDVKAQTPEAICEARPTNVSTNLIVNRDAPPFDNPKIREAHGAALDRKPFIDILSEGNDLRGATMLPPPDGVWGMPQDELREAARLSARTSRRTAPRRASIMKELGYGPDKPLKIKVSTRNIAIYRDPAVILIDQLKQIYIDGELELIDTTIWYAKVTRKDYSVGLNLTGVGVDDPDVDLLRELLLQRRSATTRRTATRRSTS